MPTASPARWSAPWPRPTAAAKSRSPTTPSTASRPKASSATSATFSTASTSATNQSSSRDQQEAGQKLFGWQALRALRHEAERIGQDRNDGGPEHEAHEPGVEPGRRPPGQQDMQQNALSRGVHAGEDAQECPGRRGEDLPVHRHAHSPPAQVQRQAQRPASAPSTASRRLGGAARSSRNAAPGRAALSQVERRTPRARRAAWGQSSRLPTTGRAAAPVGPA
jgi:hypothetical protein